MLMLINIKKLHSPQGNLSHRVTDIRSVKILQNIEQKHGNVEQRDVWGKRQQFGQQCDSKEATICLLRMVKVIDTHWFVKCLLALDCRSLL